MFPPASAPSAESQEAPLPPLPLMSQWLKVGVPLPLNISAPEGALLSQKMLLATCGEVDVLCIPPPLLAVLLVKVQLANVPPPNIPPPLPLVVLPLNVQLVTVGESLLLSIPPP